MSNLTVVIDDELLRAARIKALQLDTSVNEICRQAIARFVAPDEDHAGLMRQLTALSNKMSRAARTAAPAAAGRDALYDDVLQERLPTLLAPRRR